VPLIKYVVLAVIAMTFVGTTGIPAVAQEGGSGWSDPWRFHVNIYGWLPEAPATINVDGEEVVDVPEDLDTILDSLEMTAMFELEAHKGPLVLFVNNVYYKGEYDDDFRGPISGQKRDYELEEEVWAIKYGAGYRLGPWDLDKSDDSKPLTLYPWVGAFYFHDDWKVTLDYLDQVFDGGNVNGTFRFNTPMVGLTGRWQLTDRWYLNLSYGYGGWDVDDVDEIYDFIGNVAYRFTMWGVSSKALAGYRYLYFDWKKGVTELELTCKGPTVQQRLLKRKTQGVSGLEHAVYVDLPVPEKEVT
jgi:hypothetical protein